MAQAPDGAVNLDWLLGHLDKRSFGLLLLLLGLLVIVPGIATIATIISPSAEMLLGRSRPTFPHFLSKRAFDFERFKRFTAFAEGARTEASKLPQGQSATTCCAKLDKLIQRPIWKIGPIPTGCKLRSNQPPAALI